jgi:dipeptidyl aminopeptidase/acylaminoacyl peptidase
MSTSWEARFRAARVSLPDWAEDAPHRCLYLSNATGVFELYAWDRETDSHRQVTDRPNGTAVGTIDRAGEHIWWFADTDGDEYGVWMRQPFEGGPDEPVAPDLPKAYGAGLAIGRGLAVIGASDEGGTTLHVVSDGRPPQLVYQHEEDASVGDLSEDGTLLVIAHSEHGDSRNPALRVLRLDGTPVADLWDGEGKGLNPLGFRPVAGDTQLLVQHERHGRDELLVWDVATGEQRELTIDLPGEIAAEWFPDGSALLVEHDAEARSELYRYDLATGVLERLDTPRGLVGSATARPDGSVEFSWSSAAEPPVIRSTTGAVVLTPPGDAAPRSVPVEDLWVDGPAGRIHALVSRPEGLEPPYTTVFDLHGGPTHHDTDSFSPYAAAWVDAGLAVVRVNYRGSTGYGKQWRDAIEHRVGLTELEDVHAVLDAVVASGLADPDRIVAAGGSWGGYLTLLAIGTRPDAWAAGVAAVPVADYVAAYEDEMEGLKAFDRALFGGSPSEVPNRFEASSPITYAEAVRAPVLISAGENDPRCPIRQIENYLARLQELGTPHQLYRFDAGHGSLVVEERIRQLRVELDFVDQHLGLPRRPEAH